MKCINLKCTIWWVLVTRTSMRIQDIPIMPKSCFMSLCIKPCPQYLPFSQRLTAVASVLNQSLLEPVPELHGNEIIHSVAFTEHHVFESHPSCFTYQQAFFSLGIAELHSVCHGYVWILLWMNTCAVPRFCLFWIKPLRISEVFYFAFIVMTKAMHFHYLCLTVVITL